MFPVGSSLSWGEKKQNKS
uniref:Uncharacterized protein n=1 Tax=Anguilla anguilla TaxID=7936 RepID=A0A0E9RJK7_ANGAN